MCLSLSCMCRVFCLCVTKHPNRRILPIIPVTAQSDAARTCTSLRGSLGSYTTDDIASGNTTHLSSLAPTPDAVEAPPAARADHAARYNVHGPRTPHAPPPPKWRPRRPLSVRALGRSPGANRVVVIVVTGERNGGRFHDVVRAATVSRVRIRVRRTSQLMYLAA